VQDVVKAIYSAINILSERSVCEMCNVLIGSSVTIDYLANQMIDIVPVEVGKNYKDLATGDPDKSDGTTEKL